jgi:NtrC-family two-component system sensor histidine kinase KinB
MTWNLRRKILTGYLIAMALAAAVVGLALVNIVRLGSASDAILQENYRSILAAEQMLGALRRQEIAALRLALETAAEPPSDAPGETPPDQADRAAEFDGAHAQFRDWLARAKDNITIEGEAEILDRIERGYLDFRSALAAFRRSTDLGGAAARAAYDRELLPKAARVRAACNDLHELNRTTMEEGSRRAQRVAQTAVWSTIAVGVLALIVGIGLSGWLAGLIVRPLSRLTEVTQRVATGDYDVSIRAESTDEVGELAEKFNVMIAKLRAFRELDLRRIIGEQRKAEAILATIDDGVLVVDAKRQVASLNPAARRALGAGGEKAESADFAQVVHDERLLKRIDQTLASGRAPAADVHDFLSVVDQQQRPAHFEYVLAPISGPGESALGVVVLFRNVTKLKELDRLKTEFVMTASHELRTPLTSISMSIELLRERLESRPGGAADEVEHRLIRVACDEVERLRRLVDELLNLARIESGKLELQLASVGLADVVRTAAAPFQPEAEQRGIALSLEPMDDTLVVMADARQLAWVVANLLGNALRYARSKIWVSVERGGHWGNVYVRDDGTGIPYDVQERIFEKFVQYGDPQRAGGAGLGLALAREIVRAHGGHVWVESDPGRGSLFTVMLPLPADPDRP